MPKTVTDEMKTRRAAVTRSSGVTAGGGGGRVLPILVTGKFLLIFREKRGMEKRENGEEKKENLKREGEN